MAIIQNPKGAIVPRFPAQGAANIDDALTLFCPTLASALDAVNNHAAYTETEQQKMVAWAAELGSTVAELIAWFAITPQDVLEETYATEIAASTDALQWMFIAAADAAGYLETCLPRSPYAVTGINGPEENIAGFVENMVAGPGSTGDPIALTIAQIIAQTQVNETYAL